MPSRLLDVLGLGGLNGGVLGPVLVEQPVRHFALVSDDEDTPEEEFLRERGIGVLRYSASAGYTEGMCALLAAFASAATREDANGGLHQGRTGGL